MVTISKKDFEDLIHYLKERNYIDKNIPCFEIEDNMLLDGVNFI